MLEILIKPHPVLLYYFMLSAVLSQFRSFCLEAFLKLSPTHQTKQAAERKLGS